MRRMYALPLHPSSNEWLIMIVLTTLSCAALLGMILFEFCVGNHSEFSAGTGKIPDWANVSCREAKHLVANHAPHAGTVRGEDSLPDTPAIWLDSERAEAPVQQIRKEGGDGIRFYLATYDKRHPENAPGSHVTPAHPLGIQHAADGVHRWRTPSFGGYLILSA